MKVPKEFRTKLFCYTYFCVRIEKKGFILLFKIAYSFLTDSKQHIKIYNYKTILVKMKQKNWPWNLLFLWDNDDEPRKEPNMYRKSYSRNPIFNLFFLLFLMREWLTYFKNSHIVKIIINKKQKKIKIVTSVKMKTEEKMINIWSSKCRFKKIFVITIGFVVLLWTFLLDNPFDYFE